METTISVLGVSQNQEYLMEGPHNKDSSIRGSILRNYNLGFRDSCLGMHGILETWDLPKKREKEDAPT